MSDPRATVQGAHTAQAGLTVAALRAIVAASGDLRERLDNGYRPVGDPVTDPGPAQILRQWKHMYADGGEDVFQRRLALDGWTETAIRPYLASVALPDELPLPRWAFTLARCVDATMTDIDERADFGRIDHDRIDHDRTDHEHAGRDRIDHEHAGREHAGGSGPFHDIFTATVEVAMDELDRRCPQGRPYLSDDVRADLSATLRHTLTSVATPTLALAFQAFRSARESSVFQLLRRMTEHRSNELYRAFLAELRTGGLPALLTAYPVLGRLWGTIVDAWVDCVTELLSRLADDMSLLRRHFGIVADRVRLQRVQLDLSDRHHSGRTVALLEFSDRHRVVYKPKGLGLEKAYNDLLRWLIDKGCPVPLRPVTILDRTSYGWAQFVAHESCRGQAEIAQYYRRAGALLCLIHLLEGTDCHMENIVAAGADPVLVDAETLLHNRGADVVPAMSDDSDPDRRAFDDYCWSVYRTGMLPSWTLDDSGVAVDTSGLGGFGEQATTRRVHYWEHADTDDLILRQRPGQMARVHNVPVCDGEPRSPLAHVSQLISGFTAMYQFCRRHRDLLMSSDGPLAGFKGMTSRFIARDSRTYGALRSRLVLPAAMASGIAQDQELEHLALAQLLGSPGTEPGETARTWPLVRAEAAALRRFDIPYFSCRTDSTDVVGDDGEGVAGYFPQSSFQHLMSKIAATTSEDLRSQIGYIQAAFFARSATTRHNRRPAVTDVGADRTDEPDAQDPSTDDFLAAASQIADQLWHDAIRVDGAGAAWIGLEYAHTSKRYHYQPLGYGYYSGRCGLGLFLSALWSATDVQRWRDLAVASVHGLRLGLTETAGRRQWSVEDANMCYALARMGGFLGDDGFVNDAVAMACRIDDSAIGADTCFDVLSGCAGALLSLLAVRRISGEEVVLEKAVLCGQRLLAGRTRTTTGHLAWRSPGGAALTGFSHGAAGIALALLRLFEVTGREELRDAALEAIAFERASFDPSEGNWPDYRSSSDPSMPAQFMASWCHGATGIGLSRLAARDLITGHIGLSDTGAVRHEIEAALETTRRHRHQDVDQLCCGNFGRIELFLTAGDRMGRPELVAEARQWASRRIRLADRGDGYQVMNRLPRWVRSPGFFQGTSGIGYQLLRLARPSELPVLVLWE